MEMANEYSCCDDWQDNSTAEDIARAQGCTDVADLLSKLTSVSCVHFPSFYSVYFLNKFIWFRMQTVRYVITIRHSLTQCREQSVCLCVCLHMSSCMHISKTTRLNFSKFSVHAACGSVLVR